MASWTSVAHSTTSAALDERDVTRRVELAPASEHSVATPVEAIASKPLRPDAAEPLRAVYYATPPDSSSLLELTNLILSEALILLDADGQIRSWNSGARRLFGYGETDVIGKPLQQFTRVEPSNRYRYDDMLWRARQAEGEPFETSRFVLCSDGRFAPAHTKIVALFNGEKSVTGYGVSLRLDHGDSELWNEHRERLALMATIVETLQDPLFVKDRDGRYLLINAAFAMHLGRTGAEIIGRTDEELIAPELQEIAGRTDRLVLDTRSGQEYEYTVGTRSQQRTRQVVKLPFYNAVGNACGLLGLVRDVTHRRKQELEKENLFAQEQTARMDAETMVRRLEAVQTIFDPKLTTIPTQELVAKLLDRIRTALDADIATICLLSSNKKELVHCQARGATEDDEFPQTFRVGEGIIGRIVSENRPMVIADRRDHEVGNLFDHSTVRALIGAPLSLDGELLGVLYLGSRTPGVFSADDLHILQLVANRAASTIERGRLFEELNAANVAMHRLSHRMLEVQEEERRHLSRELHDEIGQILTGIKLHLQSTPAAAASDEVGQHMQIACDYVDEAIGQVRRLSTGLRPPALDVLGLEAALRESVQRLTSKAGIREHIDAPGIGRFDRDLEITIFRIAQEAITNVIRHSRALEVKVTVRRRNNCVVLTVEDDGVGFDVAAAGVAADAGRSFGLRSMEERAMLMDGTLELKSRPGKGTLLQATFPIEPQGNDVKDNVPA